MTAAGKAITRPLPGAGQPNPLCAAYQPIDVDKGENAHSIGLMITFGKFRVVDLGDLYWNQEYDLACPNNLLGTVDVYMTTHHAKKTSGAPALVQALHARAAIVNNGPDTGASPSHWQTIHESPGPPDIWQLHLAESNDKAHNAPAAFIANRRRQGQRLLAQTLGLCRRNLHDSEFPQWNEAILSLSLRGHPLKLRVCQRPKTPSKPDFRRRETLQTFSKVGKFNTTCIAAAARYNQKRLQ